MNSIVPLRTFLLSLLVFLFFLHGISCQLDPRIVNGFNVTSMRGVEYLVSLRRTSYEQISFGAGHSCGGTLIKYDTVLTAAHCVHDGKRYLSASNFVAVMGNVQRYVRDNNTVEIAAKQVIGHKNYNPDTFANDIALIILSRNVSVNHPTVKPIQHAMSPSTVGASCFICGWGTTAFEGGKQPNVLLGGYVTINSRAECNLKNRHDGDVKVGMFCAGSFSGVSIVDSCQGDSGGPLVCGNILYGITSNGRGCGFPNYPGIYTDVYYYKKWIETNDSSLIKFSYKTIFSTTILIILKNLLIRT